MYVSLRVVKVGGSLFDWPKFPLALDDWLNEQPPTANVLIAGGGSLVDTIRHASQAFPLDDETAHWLSIDAMSVNSRLLANLLADSHLISIYDELQSALKNHSCRQIVFDVKEFLSEHENHLPGRVLPHNWTVTSDSIAARVAEVLAADELVLLKSADPPAETAVSLAESEFVDEYFPMFDGCRFRRRFVNLRSQPSVKRHS